MKNEHMFKSHPTHERIAVEQRKIQKRPSEYESETVREIEEDLEIFDRKENVGTLTVGGYSMNYSCVVITKDNCVFQITMADDGDYHIHNYGKADDPAVRRAVQRKEIGSSSMGNRLSEWLQEGENNPELLVDHSTAETSTLQGESVRQTTMTKLWGILTKKSRSSRQ